MTEPMSEVRLPAPTLASIEAGSPPTLVNRLVSLVSSAPLFAVNLLMTVSPRGVSTTPIILGMRLQPLRRDASGRTHGSMLAKSDGVKSARRVGSS